MVKYIFQLHWAVSNLLNKYISSEVPSTPFYAYLYRDIDGTPIYVGKGKNKRYLSHFNSKTLLSKLLNQRISEGIRLTPTFYACESEELAFFVEEELIRKYKRLDLNEGTLFNLTNGGEGLIHTLVTKLKMSNSAKGKPKSEEAKKNMSIARKGKYLGDDNISKKIEVRAKISKALKGREKSSEHKEKLAIAGKLRKHSLETKLKMSLSRIKYCEKRKLKYE